MILMISIIILMFTIQTEQHINLFFKCTYQYTSALFNKYDVLLKANSPFIIWMPFYFSTLVNCSERPVDASFAFLIASSKVLYKTIVYLLTYE